MAEARAAIAWPLVWAWPRRRLSTRVTVIVCLTLIFSAFAAAAMLQMRNDKAHALEEARYFDARRAEAAAAVAGQSLDRIAQFGMLFADGQSMAVPALGIRSIAVFDRGGHLLRTSGNVSVASLRLPLGDVAKTSRTVLPPGMLTFLHRDKFVSIAFDPRALVPAALLDHAALVAGDAVLAQDAAWNGTGDPVAVARWPVTIRVAADEDAALSAWTGTLPLYLFVILGPALAGAALAAFLVPAFERQARSSRAIRALKSTRPVEAKLLVRLADAERRAADDSRAKSEFIAHMSHELRTPLNAIIGFSEIIERGFFGEVGHAKYVEYARDINGAGRELHDKIGAVLEYANVEAGQSPLAIGRVDVAEIARASVAAQMGRAFSRKISLLQNVPDTAEALGDGCAVERVLTALLDNALAFTPDGGSVLVDIASEEGAIALLVADSGPPFGEADVDRAFPLLDRSGQTGTSGLGLAIAFALARRMNGAVRVARAAGRNCVEFRLPKA